MIESIRGWVGYITSVAIGTVGFLNKCKEVIDLLFVVLGCIGLILSIRLTLKKLKKKD